MSDKRKPANKQQPEHTLQVRDVTATIHLQQSHCGHQYYAYTLSRTWTSLGTGKQARGGTFFESNQQALVEVIAQASEWVRQKTQGHIREDASIASLKNSQQKSSGNTHGKEQQ